MCDAAARVRPLCISAELFVGQEIADQAIFLAGYAIAGDFGCLILAVSEQDRELQLRRRCTGLCPVNNEQEK